MWFKMDDGFATHPKILAAGPIAAVVQIRAFCYACQYRTDGFIPTGAISYLLAGLEEFGVTHELMVAHGLWEVVANGYRIHDYLDWNCSKAQYEAIIKKKRRAGKSGASKKWSSGPALADDPEGNITEQEWQEMCAVYGRCLRCQKVTNALVRDHVIPRYQGGTNHVTNIQPLCRRCNSSKGADTTDYRVNLQETKSNWLQRFVAGASHVVSDVPANKKWQNGWHPISTSTSSEVSASSVPDPSLLESSESSPNPSPKPTKKEKTSRSARVSANGKSGATWLAYAMAYEVRYHAVPVRNAKVNAMLATLVDRLGIEEAPLVAAFYLTHNRALYVQARHPTNLLLRDAEGLRTEWATGVKATGCEAKNAEAQDAVVEQIKRVRKQMEEGRNGSP